MMAALARRRLRLFRPRWSAEILQASRRLTITRMWVVERLLLRQAQPTMAIAATTIAFLSSVAPAGPLPPKPLRSPLQRTPRLMTAAPARQPRQRFRRPWWGLTLQHFRRPTIRNMWGRAKRLL